MAEMKQLREIAESYYEASSREVKAKVTEFFRSMDDDGDEKVDLEEFLTFMRNEGYAHMRNNSFFKELDETGHGALSFVDVITLYYIIKSGRPFCDSCAAFIPGIFFSCVRCFNDTKTAFNICPHCYSSDRCKHSHDGGGGGGGGRGRALFLDNYTLLHATRHSPTSTTIINQYQATPSRRHGKSPRGDASVSTSEYVKNEPRTPPAEDVLPASASDDFVTTFMKNEFNSVVAQSQSDYRPLKRSASKDVATPLDPNTDYVSPSSRRRTKDPATSTAIVPATKPPKGKWTDVASVSFKALDKLVAVGNLVGVVAAGVSTCTIM